MSPYLLSVDVSTLICEREAARLLRNPLLIPSPRFHSERESEAGSGKRVQTWKQFNRPSVCEQAIGAESTPPQQPSITTAPTESHTHTQLFFSGEEARGVPLHVTSEET